MFVRRGDESCGVRLRPPSGALHSIEQGHSAATLPRVIQHPGTSNPVADIDRLASSSCMGHESQADAHAQTNADSCAGSNNRDVCQLFLTQVSSTTKPSTRLRTVSHKCVELIPSSPYSQNPCPYESPCADRPRTSPHRHQIKASRGV